MDLGLAGRVALVTGGSLGIGRATALGLAREGCALAIVARRQGPLAEAAERIRGETGAEVLAVPADLTRDEDARRAVDTAAQRYGGLDVVVNCAGAAPGGLLEGLTEEQWLQGLQLKFLGYVRVTRAALPHLLRRGGGAIVNVVGNDGIKPAYWEIVPGAANAAGLNLTQAIAEQYGPRGIRINAVNPGPVDTGRWDGLVRQMARDKELSYEEADRLSRSSLPLGRLCRPEEVADVVLFLASQRASYVNGAMVTVDGGQRKALMDA